jgi:hypothetical protein
MVYTTGLFLVTKNCLHFTDFEFFPRTFTVKISQKKFACYLSHRTNVWWTSAFNEVKLIFITVCLMHGINEENHGFGCHGKVKKI